MAPSGSVFSSTLHTITTTKLGELAKQRATFNAQLSTLLHAAEAEKDTLKRLYILVDGAKSCLDVKTFTDKHKVARPGRVIKGASSNFRLETDLRNLDRFLEQARYDPSVSPKVLQDWEKCIRQYLSVHTAKLQYADLYGKLITECVSSEDKASLDEDTEMSESFEMVSGAQKMEARYEWENIVFHSVGIELPVVKAYLNEVFIAKNEAMSKALQRLRTNIHMFETNLIGEQFTHSSLICTIQGLQRSDLLSNEKRAALKDFLSNNTILVEIADVLNLRMAALDRWEWGDYVPLESRRTLNGGYSVHMHEDLLQAIFLQYIGVKWSVFLKSAFLELHDQAFTSGRTRIPEVDLQRRLYFLGSNNNASKDSLEEQRARLHRQRYLSHQLLDHVTQTFEAEQGEEEAEFDDLAPPSGKRPRVMAQLPGMYLPETLKQLHQMQSSRNDYSSGYSPDEPKRPMEAKQGLLHLLATESLINTRLHGEFTCFHSVFEALNPKLPHTSILIILEFFGVSDKWLRFFKTFLRAPLKFMEDDASTAPRLRRRGTPGSHVLSEVFAEAILFCLDFSVNQATGGGRLHRLYDDFWFWSADHSKCIKAWSTLNEAKTGSVRASAGMALPVDDSLPQGEIRWGFLTLNPDSGRFDIDEKSVKYHIEELRKQLESKSKSVVDLIQAWNTFGAKFFSSNFGKAANCFGRGHVDKMLSIHRHIQESLFADHGGSIVQFLKTTIKERFEVADVPDGFLYFPVELGGLDLKSPFVNLLQIRESVEEASHEIMDEFERNERADYEQLKRLYDEDLVPRRDPRLRYKPPPDSPFFGFDEYSRYREECGRIREADLVGAYRKLLECPVEESIDFSQQIQYALSGFKTHGNLRGSIHHDWMNMEAYWRWIAQMYGPEMMAKFGGLNVVDPGMLPMGMVSQFRQKRVEWKD